MDAGKGLEQAIKEIEITRKGLEQRLKRPRDLLQFHTLRGALAAYEAALALLQPVMDMAGPELRLQRAYLQGLMAANKEIAKLLQGVQGPPDGEAKDPDVPTR